MCPTLSDKFVGSPAYHVTLKMQKTWPINYSHNYKGVITIGIIAKLTHSPQLQCILGP